MTKAKKTRKFAEVKRCVRAARAAPQRRSTARGGCRRRP
jgi:hypothetical protein